MRHNTGRRLWARWAVGLAGVAVSVGASTGTACADGYNTGSHNAPRVGLINTGQIDDPLEDVLEHASLWHVVVD